MEVASNWTHCLYRPYLWGSEWGLKVKKPQSEPNIKPNTQQKQQPPVGPKEADSSAAFSQRHKVTAVKAPFFQAVCSVWHFQITSTLGWFGGIRPPYAAVSHTSIQAGDGPAFPNSSIIGACLSNASVNVIYWDAARYPVPPCMLRRQT